MRTPRFAVSSRSFSPPRPPRSRRGAVLHITVGAIAATAVAWMGIASVSGTPTSTTGSTTATSAKRLKFRSPSTPIEIEAALGELGLTPKTLCAAGFSAQQTGAFTSAVASYARANIATYRAAMDAAGTARNEVNRLTRLIQGGAPSAEDLSALTTAQSTLATAMADRQAFLDSALAQGTATVTGDIITLLNTVRTNSRAWDIPASYLGDNRSEAAWVNLRDALANDRISTSLSQTPDPTCHSLLLAAQATDHAAAAISNLSNLTDIQTAWNTALNP